MNITVPVPLSANIISAKTEQFFFIHHPSNLHFHKFSFFYYNHHFTTNANGCYVAEAPVSVRS